MNWRLWRVLNRAVWSSGHREGYRRGLLVGQLGRGDYFLICGDMYISVSGLRKLADLKEAAARRRLRESGIDA